MFFVRILAVLTMLWAGGLSALAFEGPSNDGADASSSSDESADPSAAAPATLQAYEAGIKAYQEGKTDLAIRALSKALEGGGLDSQKIAHALYYRGLAYRQKGEPGRAISDLTSSVWLKDGLNQGERQQAMSARVAAYQEAGISNVPQLPSADLMMSASAPSSPDGWQTAANAAPMGSIDPQFPPSSTPAPPPQSSSSGGGISGFFNNVTSSVTSMFGGGSSSSSNDAVTTASLPPVANDPAASAASWSGNTQVAAASPSQGTAEPAPFVTEVATSTAAVSPPSGKYRLQVASVRSRAEADNLAYRLVSEHGSELGPRAPVVDEAIIGSMGTFYRVRVGPYANAAEPQQVCNRLRSSGFDCLVVTN